MTVRTAVEAEVGREARLSAATARVAGI